MTEPTKPIPERKIILMGDVGVGKSSLVYRLQSDKFSETYAATIGVVVKPHVVTDAGPAHDQSLRLAIWDTDGNFRDNIFQRTYMSGATAGIVVSDAARPQSIELMAELISLFMDRMRGRPVHAVITKTDLVADPQSIVIPKALTDVSVPLHLTSSKSGQNVRSMFTDVATTVLRRGL
jgi:small GTP-binding protein